MREKIDRSLSYIGTTFQIDATYFAKGGFFTTIQQVIGITAGLTVSYLFGHFVSKDIFGEYNLVLSIVGMITFMSLPGVNTALTQSVGKGYDSSLTEGLRTKIQFSLLGIPVLLGFAAYYWLVLSSNSVAIALVLFALLYPIVNSFALYRSFLTAKRLFGTLAGISVFSSLFFLASIAAAVFIFSSAFGLIAGYIVGISIPSIIGYNLSRKFIATTKRDTEFGSYGKFLTALSILPWVSGNIGNVILGTLLGAPALATFSVATRFLASVQKNFIVFYKPAAAKLAMQSSKQHLETLRIHAWKFLAIGFGLFAVFWIATPLLVRFFFTDLYAEAIFYGQVLSTMLIVLPITWMLDDMLIYQKKKRSQIIANTIPEIIKTIFYFIAIPIWGINGLIVVALFYRFTIPVVLLVLLVRNSK